MFESNKLLTDLYYRIGGDGVKRACSYHLCQYNNECNSVFLLLNNFDTLNKLPTFGYLVLYYYYILLYYLTSVLNEIIYFYFRD